MAKMKITIGLGKMGGDDGGEMDDYESGFYDAKDQIVSLVAMHKTKGVDAKTAHDEILKLIEGVECEGMDDGPPSRPSGAGMAEDDGKGEDY